MNATNTAKTILSNVETLELCQRLRNSLSGGMWFEQALYQIATPADIIALETLIGVANHLRSEVASDEEQKIGEYLMDSKRPDYNRYFNERAGSRQTLEQTVRKIEGKRH